MARARLTSWHVFGGLPPVKWEADCVCAHVWCIQPSSRTTQRAVRKLLDHLCLQSVMGCTMARTSHKSSHPHHLRSHLRSPCHPSELVPCLQLARRFSRVSWQAGRREGETGKESGLGSRENTGVIVVIFSQPRIGTLSAATTTISHRPRSSSSSHDPHRRLVPHPLRANYRVLLGVEVRWRNSGWTWQPTVRERKQC